MGLSYPVLGLLTAGLAVAVPLLMGLFWQPRKKLAGKHVLITGGSKGIGLALAEEFVRRGSHVTVVARKQVDLVDALQMLTGLSETLGLSCKLQALSADTSNPEQITEALRKAIDVAGPIDVLICNAGLSLPGRFVDQDMEMFERQVQVNYLGTVATVKAALPAMLARKQGHIVLVASALAVLGFAGYASYAPSKWAVRGLADCLRNELQGTGVTVSVGYPPDTDTPGYAHEQLSKPDICKQVNKALGSELFPASKVAQLLARGIERGAYHLPTPDLGQVLLVDSMASISPKPLGALGCLLAPIVYLVTAVLRRQADNAARRCNQRTA
ncbi:hypothetical protein N2152v2_004545 [Parachlorella kessleri]